MKGQWIGRYSGTFDGQIVVNVDEYQEHYQGIAYLIDDNKAAPRVAVGFQTPNKDHEFTFRTREINVFDPVSQQISTPDGVQQYFPGVPMADFVDVKISWADDELRISSTTNIGRTTNSTINDARLIVLQNYPRTLILGTNLSSMWPLLLAEAFCSAAKTSRGV